MVHSRRHEEQDRIGREDQTSKRPTETHKSNETAKGINSRLVVEIDAAAAAAGIASNGYTSRSDTRMDRVCTNSLSKRFVLRSNKRSFLHRYIMKNMVWLCRKSLFKKPTTSQKMMMTNASVVLLLSYNEQFQNNLLVFFN